jgi:hypothetical protein
MGEPRALPVAMGAGLETLRLILEAQAGGEAGWPRLALALKVGLPSPWAQEMAAALLQGAPLGWAKLGTLPSRSPTPSTSSPPAALANPASSSASKSWVGPVTLEPRGVASFHS